MFGYATAGFHNLAVRSPSQLLCSPGSRRGASLRDSLVSKIAQPHERTRRHRKVEVADDCGTDR
jgi:hypothetical protein